ncbi:aminotransferase class IV [Hyalangium rubrum]|uniref:Aminotransferase class IV n=1 Tax=Hyalangium rubrum TaxID=3103134 RepID=A0ABU5H7G8_9BACT|nr:aminotransferase class IV [Hyalangium sp. s54d21]MDY7229044.1 aminotransferase class IV [Hyalangium sp. s54d21]
MFGTVAVNGAVHRLEELRLQDFPSAFFFGAGFFETFLVRDGAPMFLERHLARLRTSLAAHGGCVHGPPAEVLAPAAVREALGRCLEADAALGPGFTGVGKLTAGDGRLLLSFRSLSPNHEHLQRHGRSLDSVEDTCYRRGDRTLQHKSLSYLRQHLHMERMPVFLNEAGEVCEVPNANLFLQLGEVLVTPPVDAPCLPGIIREVLLEAGHVAGLPVVEQPVHLSRLNDARACFLTNSVGLAIAVTHLLGRSLPESLGLAEDTRKLIESAG